MVEVGVRILDFELLNDPPGGSCVGDVAVSAFRYPRVKHTDHPALAIEDERARVALGGERPRLLIVVVDGEFYGLDAKLIASVGLQAGEASHRKVTRATVFHDDDAGLAIAVETVGIGQEIARETAVDPELAIGGELEHRPTVTLRVEFVGELLRSILGP